MYTVYLSVPFITPPVSVVPVIDGQLISLNISINVSIFIKVTRIIGNACIASEYCFSSPYYHTHTHSLIHRSVSYVKESILIV